MKFGVREICNVVFKAKADVKIGNTTFKANQPVLYIDSAKTSSLEGSAETVYAKGGPGNTNLIAWEGEKTLTFTVEDALLSPIGFAILSGAGLFKGTEDDLAHVHTSSNAYVNAAGTEIDLTDALGADETICTTAPIFVCELNDGSFTGNMVTSGITVSDKKLTGTFTAMKNQAVFVDFYVKKKSSNVSELQIDAGTFGGFYYVEASTYFRRESDGKDLPAEITLPNVKIQSNFTFSMASTGDPSTFTFTMDAFPGYTFFDKTKKVLGVIQIIDESAETTADLKSVMACTTNEASNS